MIANFLKFISIRLLTSFLIFLITAYISMYILHEQMGGGRFNPFIWMVLAIVSIFVPYLLLNYIGKLRFNVFLMKANMYDLSLHSTKAIKRFEKLLQFASSFYFSPATTEKLQSQIYRDYSKLYLGLHARSKAAQEIYEETLLKYPEDSFLQNILLDIYAEKDNLSKKELEVCSFIFKHSNELRRAVEILSKYYIKNKIFDFDSQNIFTKVIRLNTASKEKVIDFLVLKLIELHRRDDFAAEVYLTAYSEYSNNSEAVIEAIIVLTLERKKRGCTDGNSQKIFKVYNEIPEPLRKQLEDQIIEIQQEKEAVLVAKKKLIKELILKIVKEIFEAINSGKASLKRRVSKLQTSEILKKSLTKKYLFAILSSLILLPLLLITIFMFQKNEVVKPAVSFKNIKLQYTLHESKLPYSIQVAAFKTLSRAKKAINELTAKGEKAYYTKTSGKTVWYRVRVGEFKTKKEARSYAEKLLKAKQIKGYFITTFDSGFAVTGKEKNEG